MVTNNTIIISMTSWAPRLDAVPKAFNAVISQIEPDMDVHCVLVLSVEEFPQKKKELPKCILDLPVEILWTKRNTRSHKKLMPTLKKYPNNPIIVIDDDTCQTSGWLRTFIEDHKKYPDDIIFGQSTSIVYVDLNNNIHEFRNGCCYEIPGEIAYTQKPASGGSGTLFPPHTFHLSDFYDEDLMMKLSPTCDETWQWAFAMMEGKNFRALSKCNLPLFNEGCNQDDALIKTNIKTINNIHAAIAERFPKYKQELKNKQGTITVALYSHDERLKTVHKTLESLASQNIKLNRIVLTIPKGQKELLSEETRKLERFGLVDIYETSNKFKGCNKFLIPILKSPTNITIVVEDNYIYPIDMVYKLWIEHLIKPNAVIVGDCDENQRAICKSGLLIPPSTIASSFNVKTLEDCADAPNALLNKLIESAKLNLFKKLDITVERHSDLEDELDDPKIVKKIFK